MNEYEQQEQRQELEERIANLDKMEQAARAKIYRDSMRNQQRQTDKAFSKALSKVGVTPQAWQRMISEDPGGVMEAFKDHVKSYVKTVVKSRGQQKEPKGRIANARPPRQEPRRSTDFEELKEKAARGRITDDDLLSHLSKLL